MDRVLWMAMGTAVAAGVAWAAGGHGMDVLLGVTAPVLSTAAFRVWIARVWATAPETSLSRMIRAFAVKSVFYIVWVAIMVKGLEVRPLPFVASLVGSFVVLHFLEAWGLKRLMQT